MSSEEPPFSFSPDEIRQGTLLAASEHVLDASRIGYELERMLDSTPFPGGIPKAQAFLFPLDSQIPDEVTCQIREVVSYGLLDPALQITSTRQRETQGKAVANTASALIIARMTTGIKKRREDTSDRGNGSFQNAFRQIDALPIPNNPSLSLTQDYLTNAQELFVVILRDFLNANLHETLTEIATYPSDNPYQILLTNLTKVAVASGYADAEEFLARGNVTPTNHFYALLQLVSVLGSDVPLIRDQGYSITREQATTLFANSPVESGLAKNSKPLLAAMAKEGEVQNPHVGDGIITHGLWVSRRQRAFAPFLYDPNKFHIIPHSDPTILGICVLTDPHAIIAEARKVAFTQLQHDPPASPRVTTTCPARQLRYMFHRVHRHDKHSDAIRFVQELATAFLTRLNQRYTYNQRPFCLGHDT